MNIELTACNNKLTVINNNRIEYIFSYKSLIAVYYNNYLFLDSYYKNYSVTTNKHISFIKQYYYLNKESGVINIESALFDYLTINNFNKDLLKQIINIFESGRAAIEYIKDFQLKYNDPEVKKDLIKNKKYIESILNLLNLITGGRPDLYKKESSFKTLKTVNKIINTYTVNNISFKYERTYKNSSGALINIKIKKIKESNIKRYLIKNIE